MKSKELSNKRKSTLNLEVYKDNEVWYIVDNITGTRVGVVRLGSKGYRIKIYQIKNTYEVYNYLYKRRQFEKYYYLLYSI